jgi:hypothetical protein
MRSVTKEYMQVFAKKCMFFHPAANWRDRQGNEDARCRGKASEVGKSTMPLRNLGWIVAVDPQDLIVADQSDDRAIARPDTVRGKYRY